MSSPFEGYMFEIRPTRVSLVKRPANKRKFLVTKSEESIVMDEIIQVITETEASNEEALVETLKSQGKDDGTVQAALALARTLSAFSDSISEEELAGLVKTIGIVKDEEEVATDTEATEVVEETAEEALEEVEAEPVEAEKAEEAVADEAEEVEKSEDSELEELRKKVAELEQANRKAELSDMVDGLKVGKAQDELVDILKAVDDAGGNVEQVVDVLRSADQIVRQGFGEIGSDLPGDSGTDAWQAIEKAARTIMKSDSVDYSHAMDMVHERHPELVAEYYKN